MMSHQRILSRRSSFNSGLLLRDCFGVRQGLCSTVFHQTIPDRDCGIACDKQSCDADKKSDQRIHNRKPSQEPMDREQTASEVRPSGTRVQSVRDERGGANSAPARICSNATASFPRIRQSQRRRPNLGLRSAEGWAVSETIPKRSPPALTAIERTIKRPAMSSRAAQSRTYSDALPCGAQGRMRSVEESS